MKKYLIINADDFGYNKQQNEAIKELLSKKLITSTSVLAVAPAFEDAAWWLKDNKISAGVHLAINSDSEKNPWLSITGNAHLGRGGALYHNSKDIALHATHKSVRDELEAQYGKMIEAGVEVDHADNHSGTLYGINLRRFYNDAYDFCRAHNLPYRFPKTPGFIERQLGKTPPRIIPKLHKMLVNKAEKHGVRLIDDLISNPWNMDRIGNYETLRKWYLDSLDGCAGGVTEMFLHPALPVSDEKTEWTKRVFEYELLKSGDILQKAHEKNIEVVTWKFLNHSL
ncbi:MAG: ChbG/HpnK family deacetylase [Clostridia bacterium]|nr:ChbG/HpnK family deacetylase [Clostridia bacterium]